VQLLLAGIFTAIFVSRLRGARKIALFDGTSPVAVKTPHWAHFLAAASSVSEFPEVDEVGIDPVEEYKDDLESKADDQFESIKTWRFKIVVLAWQRPISLKRLLSSLLKADYQGDAVDLEIRVDGGEGKEHERTIVIARGMEWDFGEVNVFLAPKNFGLAASWMKAWSPESEDEHAIILEDDNVVSKHFYRYVKTMFENYGDRPEVAGVTLQRGELIATGGKRKFESSEPFGYRLLGSWGFAPHPHWWKKFVSLDLDYIDPSVPGLVTTKYWSRQNARRMWTQHFIWFCQIHNLFTIYLNAPGRTSFGVNYREKGIHFSKAKGPDSTLIETWDDSWNNPPQDLPLFGWNFQKEAESPPLNSRGPDFLLRPGFFSVAEAGAKATQSSSLSLNIGTPEGTGDRLPEVNDVFAAPSIEFETSEWMRTMESVNLPGWTNPIEDLVETYNAAFDASRLAKIANNTSKDGLLFIQFLNDDFVDLTKAWICNVNLLPRVLDRTLFVCADSSCYERMQSFSDTSQLHLTVVLLEFPSASVKELRYGELGFFWFILYRACLMRKLSQAEVSFFLIEADAFWLGDVTSLVLELKSSHDIIVMQNRLRTKRKTLNGGFMWFRNSTASSHILDLLVKGYATRLSELSISNRRNFGLAGNEQILLLLLLLREKANSDVPNLDILWLPPYQFASGQWFSDSMLTAATNPYVILNNWARGTEEKKIRAEAFGFWLLNSEKSKCEDRNVRELLKRSPISSPRITEFMSAQNFDTGALIDAAFAKDNSGFITLTIVSEDNVFAAQAWVEKLKSFCPEIPKTLLVVALDKIAADEFQNAGMEIAFVNFTKTNLSDQSQRASIIHALLLNSMHVFFVDVEMNLKDAQPEEELLTEELEGYEALTVDGSDTSLARRIAFFRNAPNTLKMVRRYLTTTLKNLYVVGEEVNSNRFARGVAVHGLLPRTLFSPK